MTIDTERLSDKPPPASVPAEPEKLKATDDKRFAPDARMQTPAPIDVKELVGWALPDGGALWDALVESIRHLSSGPTTAPISIVITDEPLLGLAAGYALGARQTVTRARSNSRRQSATVQDIASQHGDVMAFTDLSTKANATGCALQMLSWEMSAADLRRQFLLRPPAKGAGPIICLMRSAESPAGPNVDRADVEGAPPILLDLRSRLAPEVLGHTLWRLRLPESAPLEDAESAVSYAKALIQEHGLSEIVRSLCAPGYHDFERLVRKTDQQSIDDLPSMDAASSNDLATYFVASHFPRLSPDEFVELADILAQRTPPARPTRFGSPHRAEVTHIDLAKCKVGFPRDAHDERRARRSGFTTRDPKAWEKHFRSWFDDDGVILKERYLDSLELRLTIGHPSVRVASAFLALERDGFKTLWSIDNPQAALQRLRRAVFGFPAVLSASQGRAFTTGPRLLEIWQEAMLRAPTFIRQCAEDIDDDVVSGAVSLLSMSEPVDEGGAWPDLFRSASALIFWALYGRVEGGPDRNRTVASRSLASMDSFLPWILAGDEPGRRRDAALNLLNELFEWDGLGRLEYPFGFDRYQELSTVFQLLADAAGLFADMARVDAACGTHLIVRVVGQCLTKHLATKRWQEIANWDLFGLDDVAAETLAGAALSPPMQTWLARKPGDQPLRSRDPAQDCRFVWLALRAVIEALTGVSALGTLSGPTIDAWLADASHEIADHFDMIRLWEIERDAEVRGNYPDAIDALRPLKEMFPVAMLMIAAARPPADPGGPLVFHFGAALRRRLLAATDIRGETTIRRLLEAIAEGIRFQAQWANVLGGLRVVPADIDRVKSLRADRVEALLAFRDALIAIEHLGMEPV